jgi:hypothetical protein
MLNTYFNNKCFNFIESYQKKKNKKNKTKQKSENFYFCALDFKSVIGEKMMQQILFIYLFKYVPKHVSYNFVNIKRKQQDESCFSITYI